MASASSIPNPVCPHSADVPCSPLGCVKISGVSTKSPWSLEPSPRLLAPPLLPPDPCFASSCRGYGHPHEAHKAGDDGHQSQQSGTSGAWRRESCGSGGDEKWGAMHCWMVGSPLLRRESSEKVLRKFGSRKPKSAPAVRPYSSSYDCTSRL
jgi:hypothetical protein